MTRYYGALPKTPDARDYIARPTRVYTGAFVDLSDGFPEQPYDQLKLGACVSNGVAAAVDYARVKQGLKPFDRPSRLFIYWCGRRIGGYPATEDSGLQIRDGVQALAQFGAPPESEWPYSIGKFMIQPPSTAFAHAAQDEAIVYGAVKTSDIDAMIAAGHPVVFGFSVYESFETPEVAATGVMPVPAPGEQLLGGHCVVACSTALNGSQIPHGVPGIRYRLCRNSWGHDGTWGIPAKPGYFWMPTSQMETADADCWQVTTMSDPAKPTPPGPAPVDPDDAFFAGLRTVWAQLDRWLRKLGL